MINKLGGVAVKTGLIHWRNIQPKCTEEKDRTVKIWIDFFFAVFLFPIHNSINYSKNVATNKFIHKKSK